MKKIESAGVGRFDRAWRTCSGNEQPGQKGKAGGGEILHTAI